MKLGRIRPKREGICLMGHQWSSGPGDGTKSGRCPPPPKGYRGSCYESCKGDQYCPPKHKCCSNGCGRSCKLAVTDSE
uniref:WAP domain-containing protein n=1 Tax=Ornithorhynchus anatinus TaxID=9258 RepID=A0A6I8P8T3_ORNAN